jgi:hypothetical protein
MTAEEIRRVKIPPDANFDLRNCAAMIFEALVEIAAQLAEGNEREKRHDDELRDIMAHARGRTC